MEEQSVSSKKYATGKELEYQDLSPKSSCELSFESESSAKGTIFPYKCIHKHNIHVRWKSGSMKENFGKNCRYSSGHLSCVMTWVHMK